MYTAHDILILNNRQMITADMNLSIREAVKIMNDNKIGAIVATSNNKIVGIYTERDLLKNILSENFDLDKSKVADYMTTQLISAPHDSSVYKLLDIFLGKRFRHILIERNGSYIGILSMGDVIKANLNQKSKELQDLNDLVSWEYYENWRFKKQ
ncbi:MAG: CBS domain-containing protein [Ignavibacteriales bacterium]